MADEHDSTNDLNRRDALKTIATGLGAVVSVPLLRGEAEALQKSLPKAAAVHKLRFFTPAQHKTVETIAELIIPADDRSPGAKAAKVNDFIDLFVSESSDEVKQVWRDGLTELDKMSVASAGKPFAQAAQDQQVALLTEISKNETAPMQGTPPLMDRFFREAKTRTVQGYYTSEIGIHKELQYKGNTFLAEFVGCTHPEHQL
jgi:hypothetical protein